MSTKKNQIENVELTNKQEENELLKAFNDLKAENEALKAIKPKTLDFIEASLFFREKARLLNEIGQLEVIKTKIQDTNVSEPSKGNGLTSQYYNLNLSYGSHEPMFTISNIEVMEEFLNFIFVKLTNKIDALKFKVQEM